MTHYLASSDRRPGWQVLDLARQHSYTGELVMHADRAVRLYLDGGTVYFAEFVDDPALDAKLATAGLVSPEQLAAGTLHVGTRPNLSRLFDREPTIDRDAVLVTIETMTADLVFALANREVVGVEPVPYAQHPLGVRRWFANQVTIVREVVEAAPQTVATPEAPAAASLPAPIPMPVPSVPATSGSAERDEPDPADDELSLPLAARAVGPMTTEVPTILADGRAEGDDELHIAWLEPAWSDVRDQLPAEEAPVEPSGDAEFQVHWPDGSVSEPQPSEAVAEALAARPQTDPELNIDLDDLDLSVFAEPPADDQPRHGRALRDRSVEPTPTVEAATVRDFAGRLSFELPPLQVTHDDEGATKLVGEVPDDVIAAVRRAIHAIEETTSAELYAPSAPLPAPQVDLPAPAAPSPVEAEQPVTATAPGEQSPAKSSAGERQSALQRLIAGLRSS
jgi:hypothetical protein